MLSRRWTSAVLWISLDPKARIDFRELPASDSNFYIHLYKYDLDLFGRSPRSPSIRTPCFTTLKNILRIAPSLWGRWIYPQGSPSQKQRRMRKADPLLKLDESGQCWVRVKSRMVSVGPSTRHNCTQPLNVGVGWPGITKPNRLGGVGLVVSRWPCWTNTWASCLWLCILWIALEPVRRALSLLT